MPADRPNKAALALLKAVERVAAGHFGKQAELSINSAMDRASEFFPVPPEKTASTPEKSDSTRQMLDDAKREFVEEVKAIMSDRTPGLNTADLKAVVSEVVKTAYSDARASRWSDELLSKAIARYDADVRRDFENWLIETGYDVICL